MMAGSLEDFFEEYEFNYSNYGNYTDLECCDGAEICDQKVGFAFEATFIPLLYSVACVVGVVGNGVLLGVLAQSRKRWSVTDTFILHLSVADLLLLFTLPFWAAQAVEPLGWSFGTPLCKLTGATFVINFYCGIFLLVCISLDRYMSIIHATQMYSRRNPWVVHVSCLGVWLFSLLLSIPDWIFLEALKDVRSNKTQCTPNYLKFTPPPESNHNFSETRSQVVTDWQRASRLLYHIVGFLLPSAVLIFCYSCILHRLQCGLHGLQKQKAVRVIVAVVVVFFVCWTPFNITLMVDTLHSGSSNETCVTKSSLDMARMITATIGYLHCSLNPVLYAFVGVKFRRQLRDILNSLGCKLRRSTRLNSAMSSRRSSFWSESGDTSKSIAI
ncbi:C-X-C chemokine receptor type 3.1 [Nelusetta ayraudi]|uniref:C-X-C chemokine receptor type 3.1 n=1 Tax=Nelusetta ayraudi TaxID=303726 RepID=UPI003F71EAD5